MCLLLFLTCIGLFLGTSKIHTNSDKVSVGKYGIRCNELETSHEGLNVSHIKQSIAYYNYLHILC